MSILLTGVFCDDDLLLYHPGGLWLDEVQPFDGVLSDYWSFGQINFTATHAVCATALKATHVVHTLHIVQVAGMVIMMRSSSSVGQTYLRIVLA